MRVIIAGGRDLTDYTLVERAMERWCAEHGQPSEVVSGGQRGIDRLGENWALERGVPVARFPADWRFGKIAGPVRNRKMAQHADGLVAIPDPRHSPGTRNMIEEARARGLTVMVYDAAAVRLARGETSR